MKQRAKHKKPAKRGLKHKAARPSRPAPPKSEKGVSAAFAAQEQRPRVGLEASVESVIPHEWTIRAYDPRLPAVLSTPAMIGMMEMAAAQAVQAEVPPGAITVGTRIEVDHLKAVPAGATVRAKARLIQHDGRFLIFEVEATSGENLIGRGRVFRAIVEPEKFHAKAHAHSAPSR